MDLSLKVDTVETITVEDFKKKYFYPQKPVIIKGLLNHIPARKWDLNYMKDKLGRNKVGVFDNRIKKDSAYTIPDLEMPFSDFADIIAKDEKCPYRLFLFNGFRHAPQLKKEFPCPDFFKGIMGGLGLMFFGGKQTGVRMHFDSDMSNVLHTQVHGRKQILLFAPEYSDLLYKLPFNTFCLGDPEKPDYEKHPALRYVKGYKIELEPGDTLFMPSAYWHYMKYLEGGFAVTYRKLAGSLRGKYNGLMYLTFRLWFDKLMLFLAGKKWVAFKERFAVQKANEAMKHHDQQLTNKGSLALG
jgi:hypothetical protein